MIINLKKTPIALTTMNENISTIKFAKTIQNKLIALEFMCDRFEKNSQIKCPYYHANVHYVMFKGRVRCIKCRTDHNPFYWTWLYKVRIDIAR